jgi:ureidoglycolate lyase
MRLSAPDAESFRPFGSFVTPPDAEGARSFYSGHLTAQAPGSAPVLHVNHVPASRLPLEVTRVECHPHAAQCFVPLDVSRYAVLVMPSDADGLPALDRARAYLLPGTTGVIYAPGVWHMGATVLDRPGHFTVLMWRGGAEPDDEFREISPLSLTET